jgi:DNA repair protein RadC
MSENNLKTVRRSSPKRAEPARRRARQGHTVSRYRLRLIREHQESIAEPQSLSRPAEAAAFLWKRIFDGLDREAMCAVYVDSRDRVIGWTVAYIGCLARCSVEPRGLVVPALLSNSFGVLLAHNHPAGSPEPSTEDILFTRRMAAACEVLGLKLVDSLVVAEGPTGPRWASISPAVNG